MRKRKKRKDACRLNVSIVGMVNLIDNRLSMTVRHETRPLSHPNLAVAKPYFAMSFVTAIMCLSMTDVLNVAFYHKISSTLIQWTLKFISIRSLTL